MPRPSRTAKAAIYCRLAFDAAEIDLLALGAQRAQAFVAQRLQELRAMTPGAANADELSFYEERSRGAGQQEPWLRLLLVAPHKVALTEAQFNAVRGLLAYVRLPHCTEEQYQVGQRLDQKFNRVLAADTSQDPDPEEDLDEEDEAHG